MDRCSRRVWLIKNIDKIIYEFILKNKIFFKIITVDRISIPKDSSMKFVLQFYLDNVCFKINSMLRKLFAYKCSYNIAYKI